MQYIHAETFLAYVARRSNACRFLLAVERSKRIDTLSAIDAFRSSPQVTFIQVELALRAVEAFWTSADIVAGTRAAILAVARSTPHLTLWTGEGFRTVASMGVVKCGRHDDQIAAGDHAGLLWHCLNDISTDGGRCTGGVRAWSVVHIGDDHTGLSLDVLQPMLKFLLYRLPSQLYAKDHNYECSVGIIGMPCGYR